MSSVKAALSTHRARLDFAQRSAEKAFAMPAIDGGGAFGDFREQAANRKRYALFRGHVYSAINSLANEAAKQPVHVYNKKAEAGKPAGRKIIKGANGERKVVRSKEASDELELLEHHPLLESLEYPNPFQGRFQFVYSFVANICLTGWSYIFRDEDKDGKLQFYCVPTTWVQPLHNKGPFSEFKIADPKNPAAYADTPPYSADQVGFAQLPDPSNPLGALAPAGAQSQAISIDDKIQSSQEVFFDNGIFPSVVITVGSNPHPDGGSGPNRPRLSAAHRRQVYSAIRKVSGGIANYGNPAIVDGLIEKIERLSATQNEMGWEKSEKVVRARILSAFGIHPYILGEEGVANYATAFNIEKRLFARVNCYLEMLSMLMTKLGGGAYAREKAVKDKEPSKLVVTYAPCEAIDPSQEASKMSQARTRGDITQNEWRAWAGMPPDEDSNPATLERTALQAVSKIAELSESGKITREQARGMLVALGLPDKDAEAIAGNGEPSAKEEPKPGPGMPPGEEGAGPLGPVEQAGDPPPPMQGETPAKPLGAADAAQKALALAADALREEYPEDQIVQEILDTVRGGPGSGDWGHSGRPGRVGGSGGGGGGGGSRPAPKPKPKPKPAAPKPAAPAPKPKPATPAPKPAAKPAAEEGFPDAKKKRKLDKAVEKGLEDNLAGLSKTQVTAIQNYTSGAMDYSGVNKKLREGKALTGKDKKDYDAVQDAIKAAKPLPKNTITYRGIDLPPGQRAALLKEAKQAATEGGTLKMPGLQSTSIDPAKAYGFTVASKTGHEKMMFEIKPKTGAFVDSVSAFKGEREIVLPDGKAYRVVGVVDSAKIDMSSGRRASTAKIPMIQLEEL